MLLLVALVDVIGSVMDPLCTVLPLPATVTTTGFTTAVLRYCVPIIGRPCPLTDSGVVTTYTSELKLV